MEPWTLPPPSRPRVQGEVSVQGVFSMCNIGEKIFPIFLSSPLGCLTTFPSTAPSQQNSLSLRRAVPRGAHIKALPTPPQHHSSSLLRGCQVPCTPCHHPARSSPPRGAPFGSLHTPSTPFSVLIPQHWLATACCAPSRVSLHHLCLF